MYFRRLSKVPSCRKLLVASLLSNLDNKGQTKWRADRATLLILRIHQPREEQLLVPEGGREQLLLPEKEKERKLSNKSLRCLVAYPLISTARGICWLKMMHHRFGR